MEEKIINLGGIKSPNDYRDIRLASAIPLEKKYPDSCFLDLENIKAWDQRMIGACVGHAWGKTKQQAEKKECGKIIEFSPRFLYALAKCQDKISSEGTYPRLVAKILQDIGCATETTVPNDTTLDHETYVYNRDQSKIPAGAFEEAKKYCIKSYAWAGITEEEIKQAINLVKEQKGEIVMLVRVGNEWWTDKQGNRSFAKEDLLPIRIPNPIKSGHEIFPIGYEMENGRMKIHFLNSFGDDWADQGKGYFYFDEYKPYIDEIMTAVELPNDWIEKAKQLAKPEDFCHNFKTTLRYGQRSEEVRALQQALKIDGEFPAYQEATGYYGTTTSKAVKEFQYKYSVAGPAELEYLKGRQVGPKTREQLNKLFDKCSISNLRK